jgi:NSS family neurotransmitter:Na+ symporter
MSGNPRGQWGNKLGFIIAASASAVGLGNIWRFPYITGNNGGGAFVFVYLIFTLAVALPLLVTEISFGRFTQRSPIEAFKKLRGKKSISQIIGWMAVFGAFVLLSFYSVVAGWTLDYFFKAITGTFASMEPDAINGLFGQLYANPLKNVFWHGVFMVATVAIVLGGVEKGIERWSRILLTLLFLLMIVIVGRALTLPGAAQGLSFVFSPDFSKITPKVMLDALGQTFFTLSLGMGTMITYGSYVKSDVDVFRASGWIALFDTLIALLACVMIFPITFSYGFEPAAGPGLVFKTLPVIFSKMAFGSLFSAMFFIFLFFAALTSAISLLEVVVRGIMDGMGWSRKKGTVLFGILIFIAGLPSALSGSTLASVKLIGDRNIFDSLDYLVSSITMPLCGLLLAIFVGWIMKKEDRLESVRMGVLTPKLIPIWQFCVRYVAPVAIGVVFLQVSGLLKL